jgi:hypothetical protein
MYVLILIITIHKNFFSVTETNVITTAEYTSEARCEAAGEKFQKNYQGIGSAEYICTQK